MTTLETNQSSPNEKMADGLFDSDSDDVHNEGGVKGVNDVVRPKVVLSEVRHNSVVGGQRGLFATVDVKAGSLIVLEWPILAWDRSLLEMDDGIWTIVELITKLPDAHNTSKELHPQQLGDVDAEEVRKVEEMIAQGQVPAGILANLSVSREEMIRIYLTLQHNGFQSGLYHQLCLINHSCQPNCIKFEPRAGSRGASEVWTTKDVAAGEELTICYLHPMESSWQYAQDYLQTQHGFVCKCTRCQGIGEEAVAGVQKDRDLEEVEEGFGNIEAMLNFAVSAGRPPDIEVVEESLASLDEISSTLQRKLSESNIVFAREKLRLDVRLRTNQASLLNAGVELFDGQSQHVEPACDYAQKLALTAAKLFVSQVELLGKEHSNLATSLTDLWNALDFLQRVQPLAFSPAEIIVSHTTLVNVLHMLLADTLLAGKGQETTKSQTAGSLSALMKIIKAETQRLKDLYMVAKRCPEAVRVLKRPGGVVWGQA